MTTTTTVAAPRVDGEQNPLRAGLPSSRITDPCTIVLFGATGDLTMRMLMPALYSLRVHDMLPADFAIVGYSRTQWSDDQFREAMKRSIQQFGADVGAPEGAIWDDFVRRLSYISGDFDDVACYESLRKHLEEDLSEFQTRGNVLYYLATPPVVFGEIVKHLDLAKLGPEDTKGWCRLVIEKPFGTDLVSARKLQSQIERVFSEKQIYRIDHYLGKEPVQDLLALRFSNVIFEPLWNYRYIKSVQITAAETVGVEQRGGYYDRAGALRDMIQNHVINLMTLVAMEPPVSADADALRDEKFKVLRATRPIPAGRMDEFAVRGQYGEGEVAGKEAPAYRSEPDVGAKSNTETFAAVKLSIDNWRWGGQVPFYLRSGKRLKRKNSEIAIEFRNVPHRLFGEMGDQFEANSLVVRIQPEEGISLSFNAKYPGQAMHIRTVSMDFAYGSGFGTKGAPAYERLLADAMRGNQTLFTRWDAVEAAWEVVTPVLEYWEDTRAKDFPNYAAGSQGPKAADELLAREGEAWRQL
ncbi:MAG: glucose-6-phosphate dehydrogenase [bacterium]|nr:glucose-6-phosphate dehydrogenase [bacterium]